MSNYTIKEMLSWDMNKPDPQRIHVPLDWTEREAMKLVITLPGGKTCTVGDATHEQFHAYLRRVVKKMRPVTYEEAFRALCRNIEEWDDTAKWYALNELKYIRNRQQKQRSA